MIHVGGGGGAYGIVSTTDLSGYLLQQRQHHQFQSSPSSTGLYIVGTTTSVNVNNASPTRAAAMPSGVDAGGAPASPPSDYNDLYTVGNFIGHWGATSYAMLSDLQSASTKDANSIFGLPMLTTTDLHSVSHGWTRPVSR